MLVVVIKDLQFVSFFLWLVFVPEARFAIPTSCIDIFTAFAHFGSEFIGPQHAEAVLFLELKFQLGYSFNVLE